MGPILVTGAGGLVGGALAALPGVTGRTRGELDVTDGAAVRRALAEIRPSAVINAAAQAGVDRAEAIPARTWAINAEAVADLAAACADAGVRLVHLSTDYVLDYPHLSELTEDLTPNPPDAVYARSKLAGEQAALAAGAVVVRVQWVYHPGEKGFFNAALAAIARGEAPRLVTDQVGRPTPAALLAPALLAAARGGPAGLFHLACSGETSAFGWIERAAALLGLPFAAAPATRADLGGAPRPARSCLSSERFAAAFGVTLPPWDEALAAALARYGRRP